MRSAVYGYGLRWGLIRCRPKTGPRRDDVKRGRASERLAGATRRGGARGTACSIREPSEAAGTAGFDELAFYADHFNTVEVNSTFYGQPRPDVCRRWASRTPADFEFSVKLYQKFTHPEMFEGEARRSPS